MVHRRHEFLKFLDATRFRESAPMTESWWKANIKSVKSTIELVCQDCNHVVRPLIESFWLAGSAACRCSGHGRWDTEAARCELLAAISAAGFAPLGFLCTEAAYVAERVDARTKLPIECTTCKYRPRRSELSNFWSYRSAECHCRWKTQRHVFEYIEGLVDEIDPDGIAVIGEYHIEGTKSEKGGNMPYDIAVGRCCDGKALLLVEVDGSQHFTAIPGHASEYATRTANDLRKEIDAVEGGVPLIRLHQTSVWDNISFGRPGRRAKGFDWRPYVRRLLVQACDGTLAPKVHRQPNQSVYRSGQYQSMRVGTIVAVE